MSVPARQSDGKKIVLLVEDDFDVRDVTNFILCQMGFEVLEAGLGAVGPVGKPPVSGGSI